MSITSEVSLSPLPVGCTSSPFEDFWHSHLLGLLTFKIKSYSLPQKKKKVLGSSIQTILEILLHIYLWNLSSNLLNELRVCVSVTKYIVERNLNVTKLKIGKTSSRPNLLHLLDHVTMADYLPCLHLSFLKCERWNHQFYSY